MGRKSGTKRQASVDARKQILKVRGDYMELSDDDDVDDEVIEVDSTKKYKVSQRRSDGDRNVLRFTRLDVESTLDLDVWCDELSPAQLAARKAAISAREAAQAAIDNAVKHYDGRLLLDTPSVTALEIGSYMQAQVAKHTPVPGKPGPGRPASRRAPIQPQPKSSFSIVLDPRTSAAMLGSAGMTYTPSTASNVRMGVTPIPKKKGFWKGPASAQIQAPPLVPIIRTELPLPAPAPVVDLTSEDNRSSADSKEVSFNRLQGKTFPSLVVVARPSLRLPVDTTGENRNNLDRKVKKILMYTPAQFAEYLIQQGLVKSEHYCQSHPNNKLKLGMYSDASRFPNSGGYIWISECCPPKFVSVFHESVFEGNHPPSTNFKLIYHWACQTNVQNVLQWVKIENIYLKGLYTWLRGICTVALHTHLEPLGGKGVLVEVGVISLGTTTQDGANRHVKVEVLGVLETHSRKIILKAVDPNDIDSANKNNKKRFSKILEPLLDWVDQDSTLVIDMTIEKQSLHAIGFNNVARNGSGFSNQTIMDYLRRIVPRMFQNTLSLLSRQIIQQFLDELVWREMYGSTSFEAFHSVLKNIAEQTRVDAGMSFFTRLNKVAANPFKNWSLSQHIKKAAAQAEKRKRIQQAAPATQPILLSKLITPAPAPTRVAQIPKQLTSLEPYYYGTVECHTDFKEIELNVQCPMCQKMFVNNLDLMLHLFRHISNADFFCKYCLLDCGSKHNLYTHLELKHAIETKAGRFFNCLICHDRFNSVVVLGKHMSIEHSPSELPYHCGTCTFKCSSHKTIIDHFYKKHANQGALQCPFCLMSTDLHGDVNSLSANLTSFIAHLQFHTKKGKNPKGPVKKCARCDLQFLTKEEFDDHGDKHVSHRYDPHFVPFPEGKHPYMVPKSLRDDDIKLLTDTDTAVTFSLPDNYTCKECDKRIASESHFKELMYCNKGDCKYQTLCRSAMTSHKVGCSNMNKKINPHLLDFELFCVCGYSSSDGNQMAHHLSICERKSAYPSKEAAEKASVTPGMLDVLGLVRKLGESKDIDDSTTTGSTKRRKRGSVENQKQNKRKWRRVIELAGSDNDTSNDVDDPDYETSDEEFRTINKKRRITDESPVPSPASAGNLFDQLKNDKPIEAISDNELAPINQESIQEETPSAGESAAAATGKPVLDSPVDEAVAEAITVKELAVAAAEESRTEHVAEEVSDTNKNAEIAAPEIEAMDTSEIDAATGIEAT